MSLRHVLLSVLTIVAFSAHSEDVVEIDLRTDASNDRHTIIFCVRHETATSKKGDAFVVFEKGTSDGTAHFDGAFGREQHDNTEYLGALNEVRVHDIRSEKHAPETQAFVVHVDPEPYQKARNFLSEYSVKDHFDYSHEIELTDFTQKVATAIGLYPPYRAIFRPQYVVEYYTDLTKLNRKM